MLTWPPWPPTSRPTWILHADPLPGIHVGLVAAVAADIEANMDPRKWICVEAEATMVKTSGQYVLMVMSSQEIVDAISANFDTVFGA